MQRTTRSTRKQTNRETKNKKQQNKKAQAATIPAASTYNTTMDTDGPKPQDDTTTA